MNFENARVLTYNRNHEFFDSDFRFGTKTSYEVQGYLLDLQNSIGVSGIVSSYEFFRTGLQDYQDIILNGDNFGKGRVLNFSVDESNFVQYTTYNISIEGFESGNLFNLTGEYYSGLQDSFNDLTLSHLLESFSETFNFERADDRYSYTHNLDIKFASGDNVIISPVDRAKALATYIFQESNPSFGFIDRQTSGLYTGNFKNYFNESYDTINNTASISKRFESLNPSGSYSLTLNHSMSQGENGITDVIETASIKVNSEPKRANLTSSIEQELSNSFLRSSGVYEAYRDPDSYDLISQPRDLSKSLNLFEGIGDYVISYTNDPSFNLGYSWIFTNILDKQGSFWEVTEDGTVQGLNSSSYQKYLKALSGYSEIKTGIEHRMTGFYFDSIGENKPLALVSQSENKNQFNGNISYNRRFSDNQSFSEEGFKVLEISTEDLIPTDFFNNFEILGYKEATQSIGTTTLGRRNLSFRGNAERNSSLNEILEKLKPKANNLIPSGENVHIADVNYNFSETDKSFGVNIIWNYNRSGRNGELA